MAANFPVDEGNLSFSADEYEDLFIMQSTFSNADTQQIQNAMESFGDFDGFLRSETIELDKSDFNDMSKKSRDDEMCEKVFDFSGQVDNGWSVSTQDDPIIVTRNSDGKKFVVGDEVKGNANADSALVEFEKKDVLPPISCEL